MNYDSSDTSGMQDLSPNWGSVPDGTPVLTIDGQRLGIVKERREDGLLVGTDNPVEPEYLVTAQDVSRIDQDGVHLLVNQSQAMRAHWQGTSPADESAPGGMAPGAMTREEPPTGL